MKIEEGKCYRTRDGRKVGPMKVTIHGKFFTNHDDNDLEAQLWWDDGAVFKPRGNEAQTHTITGEWVDFDVSDFNPTPMSGDAFARILVALGNAVEGAIDVGDYDRAIDYAAQMMAIEDYISLNTATE